ncbi:hypothetical protein ACFVMC_32365 [Nocardia sp. NPDC127579]|uniref:hypothetical protein n=1 Tax=Nocardia sp. NPDC127579 TaxID=3345402 RepID=UPI003639EE07
MGQSLMAWNNRLYLAWRGVHTDDEDDPSLWWTSFDGNQWDTVQHFGSRSQAAPFLIAHRDKLHMYWRGELDLAGNEDKRVYHAAFDGTRWEQGAILGGRNVTETNIYVTNAFASRIYMAARDANGDNILYWSEDGYYWDVNDRYVLPANLGNLPPRVYGFPGFETSTLMLCYVRTGDGQLYARTSDDRGRNWSAEFAVNGMQNASCPLIATWGSADPYGVYVRTQDGVGRIYQVRLNPGATWLDPATGTTPGPDSPPIPNLPRIGVVAAYGDMLFP